MDFKCPKCGCDECHRDEVDVGVGVIYGPWGCPACGWSENEEYDLSDGRSAVDEKGGAIDQYGGYHPPGSSMALANRLAEQPKLPLTSFRFPKEDTRDPKGFWAPGDYIGKCCRCQDYFVGDKRAAHCADCAYLPTHPE